MTNSLDNNQETPDLIVLITILNHLVTAPEDVKIERTIDEQGVILSVIVNAKDMGIVIGRGGSMATTIKTVMRAIGKANKMNIRVQFLEPDGTIKYAPKPRQSEDYSEPSNEENLNSTVNTTLNLDEDLKDFAVN
jgi:predicted RNA-binding protein YlqC (UPF0109 family)